MKWSMKRQPSRRRLRHSAQTNVHRTERNPAYLPSAMVAERGRLSQETSLEKLEILERLQPIHRIAPVAPIVRTNIFATSHISLLTN